ncbi:MAG: F0F1 ATP synthase subunit B [Bacteroidota bacterium]
MELLKPDVGFMFWHSAIMLLTFLVLGRFAWKPLLMFIKEREEAYRKAIAERQKIAKEIAQVETTKEKILEEAHAKSDLIIQEALDSKEALLQAATQEGDAQKQKIIEDALQVIAEERQATQSALKKQTVELVIHTTEKLLTKELSETHNQQKLIEKMINDVESASNAT